MKLFRKQIHHSPNLDINKKEQNFISKASEDKEEKKVQPFIQKSTVSKQTTEDKEQKK